MKLHVEKYERIFLYLTVAMLVGAFAAIVLSVVESNIHLPEASSTLGRAGERRACRPTSATACSSSPTRGIRSPAAPHAMSPSSATSSSGRSTHVTGMRGWGDTRAEAFAERSPSSEPIMSRGTAPWHASATRSPN